MEHWSRGFSCGLSDLPGFFGPNSVSPGVYWYRVLATNAYGDSMSSSEVRVTVQ